MFAANGVEVMIDEEGGYTPTPVISHAILTYNRGRTEGLADGVVITPSHNPPEDGGFKYNPPNGGPADVDVTGGIERAANGFLEAGLAGVQRIPYARARGRPASIAYDYITPYVADLANVVDMEAIRGCRREDRHRSAGRRRACATGSRSSSATASTRPSSTTRSTRPSAS